MENQIRLFEMALPPAFKHGASEGTTRPYIMFQVSTFVQLAWQWVIVALGLVESAISAPDISCQSPIAGRCFTLIFRLTIDTSLLP